MSLPLELHNLASEPAEEWQRALRFAGWSPADRSAAARSIDAIFRRGQELVVQTYDYLLHVPETAAILGWEHGVDEAHLEERRRFFSVWLARTLGLDSSDEFALYLFRAGKFHAGHGPRRIHTPATYITGSIGLVLAAFARYMADARLPGDAVGAAMAAWSKYLSAQLNQMLFGYQIAREMDSGDLTINCAIFGRLRPLVGARDIQIRVADASSVADVLRKFFNYYPQTRSDALQRVWRSEERESALWLEVKPAYIPRRGWRILLNGRDLEYDGGFAALVRASDEIAIFPPGR